MGLLCRRRRSYPLLAALILLLSASAISLPLSDSSPGGGARQELVGDRQALRGLGSSPPTCRSKCGSCSPCRPVHVPVQPGFSMPLEYYPEAWRCKCGNKLFMP